MRQPLPCRAAFVALCILAGACAAPGPRPEPPPLLAVDTAHFAGTVWTGSLDEPEPEEPSDALRVALWIAYVPELTVSAPDAPDSSTPLGALARQVFVGRGDEPLRARSELALGVRRLDLPHAPASIAWQVQRETALVAGTTAAFRALREPRADDPPQAAWRAFEVELSRRASDPSRLELAFAFEGLVTPRVELDPYAPPAHARDGAPPPPVPAAVDAREHVVLSLAPEVGGPPLAFALPAPRAASKRGGFLVELVVTEPPTEGAEREAFDARLASALEDVRGARERARERARGLSSDEGFRFESRSALHALERETLRRPALVFLAEGTGARLAGELALTAESEHVADYLAAVRARLATEDVPTGDARELGWFLESTAYRFLAAREADREAAPAPALRALLLRRAGELGRYSDLVLEALESSASLDELDARFARENRIFLEDGHPSTRVRAYDWLAARGLAPAGYDPLGERAERRAALSADEERASDGGSR